MIYQASAERYRKMTYRRLGTTGLKLPAVSLGFWHNFGTDADPQIMRAMCFTAFDAGITHFDLANNYGPVPGAAEENLGQIVREHFASHRDELIISTKAGYGMWAGPYGDGGSRKYLLASLDASLRRLGLPYVDIFYHHRPDPDTPLEETMGALASAVQAGKALYVGLSNYDGARMRQAAAILRELHCPFVINQNRLSILDRTPVRNGLLAASGDEGVGVIAFSPLAQGMLSDRYLDGIPEDSRAHKDGRFLKESQITPERISVLRKLRSVAQERGQTLAQMALSWVLAQPAVASVLIGASSPAQILENVGAVSEHPFAAEELQRIDEIASQYV